MLVAFLGAVNRIGLNNGEVSSILRNDKVAANITGLLIVARRFSPDGTRCNGGIANNCSSMTSRVISPN